MQSLAKCKPSEFLRQTNRIKKCAEKWLSETKVMEIRKTQPAIPDGVTDEERQELVREQVNINLSRMLDAILDEHPDETLELLALCCFVEPEDVDNYPVCDYINAVTDLLNDKAVLGFFTSLTKLGQKSSPKR